MIISKLIKISVSVVIGIVLILFLLLLMRHTKAKEAYNEIPDVEIESFNGNLISVNQVIDKKKPTVILKV